SPLTPDRKNRAYKRPFEAGPGFTPARTAVAADVGVMSPEVGRTRRLVSSVPCGEGQFLCCTSLELEPSAELNQERICAISAGEEPDGLLEEHAPCVAAELLTKVHGIEQVEELGEQADPPAIGSQLQELGDAYIHERRAVATGRVRGHLLPRRRIHVALDHSSRSNREADPIES